MPLKYDIDKIFEELERQIKKNKNEITDIEEKENNSIESPEDVKKTQEVAPATSKTTEDIHGGDEASKEIKNSQNSVNDGENDLKKNKSEKTENTGNKKVKHKNKKLTGKHLKDKNRKSIKKIKKLFKKKKENSKKNKNENKEEYIQRYILKTIKKIAAEYGGIDKEYGVESYDKKKIVEHIIKHQKYKLMSDKCDLKLSKYVQFFIDTSGVYGNSSNRKLNKLMPQIINILERQGYQCYLAACGNGFYEKDMVEDEYYGTRKYLERFEVGKVNPIACPTEETAAQMANQAEFTIILADFDGLSSICRMADLCKGDKKPYLLCTEDRYPWGDPTWHDWVDPDYCYYDPEYVYDVSLDGNPSLKEYEDKMYNNQYEDYDDNEYEENEYDN